MSKQENENTPGLKRWRSATECWREAAVHHREAQAHSARAQRADFSLRQNDARFIASSFLGKPQSGQYLTGAFKAANTADKARMEASISIRQAWSLQKQALVHGAIAAVQTICRYPS